MNRLAQPLADRLSLGAIPVAEALRYAIGLVEALREVHARGSVYGVEPAGIAIVEEQVRLVPTVPTPLTPCSPSTEQVAGRDLDARSDIFSLGAVLYEMLVGTPAFCAPTKTALRLEILERQPPPLENVRPGLARLVQKCLEKKPERRVQRMQVLLAELKLQGILARGPSSGKPIPEARTAPATLPVVPAFARETSPRWPAPQLHHPRCRPPLRNAAWPAPCAGRRTFIVRGRKGPWNLHWCTCAWESIAATAVITASCM